MTPEKLIKEGLHQLGLSCSQEQINAFLTFISELKKWNRAYNLTALKTDKDIIIKHFLDSILYLKALELHPVRGKLDSDRVKIADAGSGAGFPGIPIKIIKPEIHITLIEPSRKKTSFLRHIIRALKLDGIIILNKRIEILGRNYEDAYDFIVSRATFKIKDFIKKACPYVKEDGRLVLSKGPGVSEEIKELKSVWDDSEMSGRQSIIKKTLRLPFNNTERNLLLIKCQ